MSSFFHQVGYLVGWLPSIPKSNKRTPYHVYLFARRLPLMHTSVVPPLVREDGPAHTVSSLTKLLAYANKDDSILETNRIHRPARRRLSLPSTHLLLLPPPAPRINQNQAGTDGARPANNKGMNSFAKGDAPPLSGPPARSPPPVPTNRRADTPVVLQHQQLQNQQQQQQQPPSPRRPATELKFHPPPGGGAPVNPPPALPAGHGHGRAHSHAQGQATALGQPTPPTYPPPMKPVAPSYPPAMPPMAPSYPPPAPPAHAGQNGGHTSPVRRPRADSDAATSKLTEGFTASSDADMSYYPNPNPPPPSRNNDRRGNEFQENLWRSSMPAALPKVSGRPLAGAVDVFIGADGLMGSGKTAPITNRIRERLGGNREPYYSEPNMNNATSRRNKHPLPLTRSDSYREKGLRDDGDARARVPSPTLRDMGRTKHQPEHQHGADVEPSSREGLPGNDLERDFAGDDSDASERTALHPRIVRHRHRQPVDSPARTQYRPRAKMPESPTPRKRSHKVYDYDDEALAAIPYSTLRHQAFDVDPAQADKTSRSASQEALTLPEKLEHFRSAPQAQQLDFFCNMPLADWEASGDWFMEQFSDAMRRLRESRRARRQVIATFEEEIAQREEAVRGKTDGLDRKMRRMKKDSRKLVSEDP